MVKKKRKSILVVHEGYREKYFLEHIGQFSDFRLNLQPCYGKDADNVLNTAFKCSDYGQVVFAFFDEDFQFVKELQISEDVLAALEKRWHLTDGKLKDIPYTDLQNANINNKNPILIVSSPNSIEGLILMLLGVSEKILRGKTTKKMKEMLDAEISAVKLTEDDKKFIDACDTKIARYINARQELTGEETNYKQTIKSIEFKINDINRQKNEIVFKRFLNTKVGREILLANINQIPTIKLLLNAFGLC